MMLFPVISLAHFGVAVESSQDLDFTIGTFAALGNEGRSRVHPGSAAFEHPPCSALDEWLRRIDGGRCRTSSVRSLLVTRTDATIRSW